MRKHSDGEKFTFFVDSGTPCLLRVRHPATGPDCEEVQPAPSAAPLPRVQWGEDAANAGRTRGAPVAALRRSVRTVTMSSPPVSLTIRSGDSAWDDIRGTVGVRGGCTSPLDFPAEDDGSGIELLKVVANLGCELVFSRNSSQRAASIGRVPASNSAQRDPWDSPTMAAASFCLSPSCSR